MTGTHVLTQRWPVSLVVSKLSLALDAVFTVHLQQKLLATIVPVCFAVGVQQLTSCTGTATSTVYLQQKLLTTFVSVDFAVHVYSNFYYKLTATSTVNLQQKLLAIFVTVDFAVSVQQLDAV